MKYKVGDKVKVRSDLEGGKVYGAIKAYSEGKPVECKVDGETYTYDKGDGDGDPLCEMLSKEAGGGLSAREILHGEWFIKA